MCSGVERGCVLSVWDSIFWYRFSAVVLAGSPVWPWPSTGAHSILICQDVTGSGQEGKRRRRGKVWTEKARRHPADNAGAHAQTHAQTHTCRKTHRKPASQSISQCPLEGLNFWPLYPQRHLNTAHWVVQQSAGSASLHTHTVQVWHHWFREVRTRSTWYYQINFVFQAPFFSI